MKYLILNFSPDLGLFFFLNLVTAPRLWWRSSNSGIDIRKNFNSFHTIFSRNWGKKNGSTIHFRRYLKNLKFEKKSDIPPKRPSRFHPDVHRSSSPARPRTATAHCIGLATEILKIFLKSYKICFKNSISEFQKTKKRYERRLCFVY